ncbi:receptor-type tyrosine-protein phosphatase gamma isoform X3 [Phyllopteryx taeniolatus]|uniref:receptor-type tyrosine-protein phosphatase gamma isoform X3 n=1 Tax=Phyllopteryx taeniolatus TaxID=161469 RepID=UPI002AD3B25D|nr:receptor-type tyrosine-protein phosphatase gamma isoform X3 [Phyllopteryx taeniolatus]
MDASRAALLHILLTLQQVGGYTYRNQRKFTEDIDWSYAGTLNQNNWAKKFPSCSNAKQSPIDVEENLAQVKLQYQNLRLDGWENLTGRRTTIKNDGKTVALDVDGDFYVSGGGLGSKFKAGRITFHWGRCNASSEGSEHSLDGVKYPLEMQIYCYQPQRFESFDQTVKAGGPITALAVLFEVSSEDDNANFAPIVDAINGVSRYGKRGQVAPFSPRALLPNSTDKYFIYNGSLTTPPCSETVEWIVFKNTVYISADQLEVFCEVMTMEQAGYVMLMDYLQNNYREQQRKFMGQVFSSYTGTEELLTPVCSSEPENLEATSYNRSSLLVTWERPRAVYDSAIEKYSVSYKMADAEDAAPSEYLTDGDQDVGAILDDLVANSSYVVQVVAVCANGLYGRVSDPMTFAVPPDGPENSLIPDSNEFDYEEANYPPETFSNESVQKEDYDQAWIPTKSPATSTSGPPRRRPQNGIGATKTQSTTVAEVTTRFPSTTPLYANTSDHSGGVGPKSSESIKVDLTATTPTGSNVWMKGGKGVPSGGTTTTSTTNKTMTRPMTMTVNQTMTTNKAVNRTTTMATNTIANKTMTRPLTKTTTMNMTTAMTPNTTANKTTNMTKTVETTTYTTPEKSRTLPMDKTATVTRPTNKITTMNTTTAMTADPTANKNMTTNVTMTPPMHKTTSVTRTTVKTVNKTRTMNMTTAVATNTTANKNTTMTSPINKTTTRPLNTTTIMIRPATTTLNKTETATRTKNMTTNLIHLRDHIITPSSVLIDPYAGLTTPETDDASGVHDDDVVRVQGEPPPESPPRGPITPSMPHFSATKTSVWQNGVLLQTTPPLSKGERLSVVPPSSFPSSLQYDVTDLPPVPGPVPSARLHERPLSSTLDTALLPRQIPASPTSRPPLSFANDLPSFSSGDAAEVPEWGASLPEVSLALSPTLVSDLHAGTIPLPRPTLSFADDLASFASGEPAEVLEWGASPSEVSLPLSPTLRLSVVLSSDFPRSVATPGPTPSFPNEVELLGYGTGSTPDSFLSEDSADGFLDGICGCSLEPSASGPHVSPGVPLGAVASISGASVDLLVSSLGVLVSSFSGAASGGLVIMHSPSSPAPRFQSATYSAPPLSVAAATSEPASAPSLPSVPVTPSSADHSNGVSGSDVDQERDGVRVSASGENTLPLSTEPPSTTLESGQTPEDSGDRSSAFYFDSESGSAAGSGRAGTAPPRGSAVPSPTPPEESGSGQAENLYDNDNSSDFSIPERTQRESEKEEYPVADVSDSSHESRVGTLRDGRRKAAVPLAVISALTALGLALLIGILLYWRMCFQTAHFYVDESASPRVAATPAFTSAVSLPVCLLDEKAALPVKDFVKHVAELHRTCGFQRKFEEVQASTADVAMTSETSDHPDNKSKNRYSNILAFDRSRVRLSAADKDGGGRAGDYINANFVDGFKMRHAYIAAQGPLKSSTDDFWRMIWEQNVGIVVMITNLLEKGRRKCDQYWPADVREDYGGLVVALKSVQKLAHYTQRTFTVTKAHVKKGSQRGRSLERVVTQYHYTQWPDMGVPEHALPLISFIRKSSRARTANMGPVVVHCSAGVGRTGTYLVLDSMLRQMRQEDAVDVDGFLRHVRTQRNYLVQTQEQYVFIHDALAEAVLCGDTEVAAPRLHAYVERLLTPRHDGNTPLDRQLKLLSAEAANADDYASALHDDNRHKNRSGSLLPVERSRVRLSPCAGDASDYINASYVTGYRQSKEFIITQNPLPGTVKDFWRMIWDQNARVIVSLSGPALAQDEDEDEEAGPCVFWPGKGQPIGWETLTVTQTCENLICLADEDPLLVHRLDVRAAQDDFVLDVRLYRAPCWPNPDSGTSDAFLLLELLRREEEKEEEEGEETSAEEGPVVVLDRAGGVTAGTFCALSSLIGQLHGQRRVDVFRAARMTNLSRPGTFRTRDQLAFLYEALLGVLDKQQRQEEEDGEEDGEDGEEEPPRSAADSLQSLV